jgi:hypothetical protein
MTVDTVAPTTLRVLQEKAKSLIGSDLGRNSTFFFLIGSSWCHYSDKIFARFQRNQ